jgi:hypothetical protein
MTDNDKHLLKQMLAAGRFNWGIYQLLCDYNQQQAKEQIEQMGEKWCLHPVHSVKKLDVPLQILDTHRIGSSVLNNFVKGRKK